MGSCCTGTDAGKGKGKGEGKPKGKEQVRESVREAYGAIATGGGSCCGREVAAEGGESAARLAADLGYSEAELSALPEGANLGLSCGNPSALASLREGEVVLDLGSGGGLDVFLAARKVGVSGRAIGIDMTPEMLSRARRSAESFRERTGLDNAEFRLGEIEHLPVADASVDVVISNCVINLSPEKRLVWGEIARVLRPGGRVAVSDLALLRPLPEAVRESVAALVGCLAGAVLASETKAMAREAGLVDVTLEEDRSRVDSVVGWNDPLYREVIAKLPEGTSPHDFVTSLSITARKSAVS